MLIYIYDSDPRCKKKPLSLEKRAKFQGEVNKQVADAVSIAQRILSSNSVMVQTEQYEPTGRGMVEEAVEQEHEEVN